MSNRKHQEELYKLFGALANQHRAFIFYAIAQAGEITPYELLKTVPINQSTMSLYLKSLVEVGLLKTRQDGRWKFYSINHLGLTYVIQVLQNLQQQALNSEDKLTLLGRQAATHDNNE